MVVPPYEDRTFIVEEAGLARLDPAKRSEQFEAGRSMEPGAGIDWMMSLPGHDPTD